VACQKLPTNVRVLAFALVRLGEHSKQEAQSVEMRSIENIRSITAVADRMVGRLTASYMK
jgi:hypothetical protein